MINSIPSLCRNYDPDKENPSTVKCSKLGKLYECKNVYSSKALGCIFCDNKLIQEEINITTIGNPTIKTKITHSQTKAAWNITGEKPGGKFKIARVPYVVINDIELTSKHRKEALKHAVFINYCFNHSESILKGNNLENKSKRMIYHGNCKGCITDQILCPKCQYYEFDAKSQRENLNNSTQ